MKSPYWLGVICLCISFQSYGQNEPPKLPSVIPPSPTVANLMNFEEVPIDYYTGQPDISIPLFNKQLDAELSLPVVLKYSTMGVRIEQRSGWIGTGWSLDVGGTISRTVKGLPDEYNVMDNGQRKLGVLANPVSIYNWPSLSDLEKNHFIWNVDGTTDTIFDSEPDLYQFSILGSSGRFVVVKEDGELKAKVIDSNQKVLISLVHDDYVISGFTIIDANGYKYDFNDWEWNTSQSVTFVNPRGNAPNAPDQNPPGPVIARSAWHLSTIKSNTNVTLATFNYGTPSVEYFVTPMSYTENYLNTTNLALELQSSKNLSVFRPESVLSWYRITSTTKKLSSIVFKDNSSFTFTLSAEDSHPENLGKYLTKIRYNDQFGTQKRYFNLSQGTTNGRLWLNSVDGGNGLKYEMRYEDRAGLPSVSNTSEQKARSDAWGYNDGDFRDQVIGSYDFDAIKKGLLTQINFPTGGVKKFIWEPHTFSYEGNTLIDNFASNPRNVGTSQFFSHQFLAEADTFGTQTPAEQIEITHDQYVQISKNYVVGPHPEWYEVVLTKPGTTKSVGIDELTKFVYLPEGTYDCKVRVKFNSTQLPTSTTLSGYINIQYVKANSGINYHHYLLGGGVRIKKIEFKENDTLDYARKFNFNYTMRDTITVGFENQVIYVSSGAIDAQLGNMYRNYPIEDLRYLYTDTNESDVNDYDIPYIVKTHQPNIQISKGNYVGYKEVLVFEGPTDPFPNMSPLMQTDGWTRYEYTNAIDFPFPVGTFHYPFTEPQNLDYKRGLLLKKIVYNKDGDVLEEIVNDIDDYEFKSDSITHYFTISETPCAWTQFFDTYQQWKAVTPFGDDNDVAYPMNCKLGGTFESSCFGGDYQTCGGSATAPLAPFNYLGVTIRSGRAELRETLRREHFYDNGHAVTESKTTYQYNDLNYQLKEQISYIPEGGVTEQYKTTYEYPVGGYTSSLFQGTGEVAAINEMVLRNMINKPLVVSTFKSMQPLQKVINKYSLTDNGANPDVLMIKEIETLKNTGTAEDRIVYHKYDSSGNVLEVSQAEGMHTCYIWGYDDTLPVAKIDNVTYAELLANSTIANAITSIKNYTSTPYSGTDETNLTSTLATLRTQCLALHKPVTLIKHNRIDGMTEITDPQGKVLKYEYDALGRLIMVRDKDNNIISRNEYHFRPNNPFD